MEPQKGSDLQHPSTILFLCGGDAFYSTSSAHVAEGLPMNWLQCVAKLASRGRSNPLAGEDPTNHCG